MHRHKFCLLAALALTALACEDKEAAELDRAISRAERSVEELHEQIDRLDEQVNRRDAGQPQR